MHVYGIVSRETRDSTNINFTIARRRGTIVDLHVDTVHVYSICACEIADFAPKNSSDLHLSRGPPRRRRGVLEPPQPPPPLGTRLHAYRGNSLISRPPSCTTLTHCTVPLVLLCLSVVHATYTTSPPGAWWCVVRVAYWRLCSLCMTPVVRHVVSYWECCVPCVRACVRVSL